MCEHSSPARRASFGVECGRESGSNLIDGRTRRLRARLTGALVVACVSGGGTLGQTLDEEIVLLETTSPQIRSQVSAVSAAVEGVGIAAAGFLPRVSVAADFGYEEVDSPGRRETQGESFGREQERVSLTVTQNIFDGFRKQSDTDTAELSREAASDTLLATSQNVAFEGATAYTDVLRQGLLAKLSQTNESIIRTQLELEDERVRRCSGIAVDALLAKSRLQLAREQRVSFEGALQNAIDRYTQVFGHEPVVDALSDPLPPFALLPLALDEAIDVALRNNPLIANSSRQIDLARAAQRTTASAYYPRVDVVGSANWEDDVNAVAGQRRDWSVIVRSTWDLFTGFATRSSTAQAAFGYSSSLTNHLFVGRKVSEEVRLAWQGVLTACDRRVLLRNAVNIAAEVWEARKKLREAGRETVLNVLDAETEVFNSQINLTGAAYDETLSVYRLLLVLGRLTGDNLNTAAAAARSGELGPVRTRALCGVARDTGYVRPSEDAALLEIVSAQDVIAPEVSPFDLPDEEGEPFDFDFDEGEDDPFSFDDEEEDFDFEFDEEAALTPPEPEPRQAEPELEAQPELELEPELVVEPEPEPASPPATAAADAPPTEDAGDDLDLLDFEFDDSASDRSAAPADSVAPALDLPDFESDDGLSRPAQPAAG